MGFRALAQRSMLIFNAQVNELETNSFSCKMQYYGHLHNELNAFFARSLSCYSFVL